MRFYFQLQYIRLHRTIKEFGINPYLGILLSVLLFAWLSNSAFNRVTYCQYFYTAIALISIVQMGDAKRNEFIKNIYTVNNCLKLRLLENMLIALPFVIFLTYKHFYGWAAITGAGACLCSLYNRIGRFAIIIPSPFSKKPFEFTVGFRKYYWGIILLYLLAVISLFAGNFNLGIAAYLITFLVCMSFYSSTEPLYYVWVHAQHAPVFLKNKITTAVLYSFYITLPIAIALLCCFPAKALFIFLALIFGFLYIIAGALAKYTDYPNQTKLVYSLIMSLGIIIPPVLLVLIPYFYLTAVKKLNIYLS